MGKEKRASTFWSTSKLRMTLFRIWFVKNILVFIQILLITCIVLMVTGNINKETPILGPILYPLFSELIDEITSIVSDNNMEGWMDFLGKLISVLVSITLFTIKARSIAQSDIKNRKLKKALVDAGLYFNENGKLVKKEKSIHQDLNKDGVIDENDGKVNSNIIFGVIDAIKEFIVIANADFSGNEDEDKELFDETLTKAKLDETSAGLEELENQMKDKIGIDTIDSDSSGKKQKFSLWRKRHFSKQEELSDDNEIEKNTEEIEQINDEIIINNNIEQDAEIIEVESHEEEILEETESTTEINDEKIDTNPSITTEKNNEIPVSNVRNNVNSNVRKKQIDNYFAKFRNRK